MPQDSSKSQKPRPHTRTVAAFLAVLLVALGVRLWGIGWGLPSSTHYFSYHPDESRVMQVVLGLDWLHGSLLPHFYRYGSLQIYLVSFFDTAAYVFGNVAVKDLRKDYGQFAELLLIGRYLTVAMGVGTVWAAFSTGRLLWGRVAGLLAALFLALSPLHAQHSHWLTVDVPATFWIALSFYWAARIAKGDEKILRAALLGGLFAGLAAATKYNAALAVIPLLAACAVRFRRQPKDAIVPAVAAALVTGIGFLIGCPGSVLEHAMFMSDVQAEALHVSQQGGDDFANTGSGFVYQLVTNLRYGLGIPLLLLSLAGIVHAVRKRDPGDLLMASFVVPYYILISLPQVRYARYAVPLLPFFCLWAGRVLASWWRCSEGKRRIAPLAVSFLVAALTLVACAGIVLPMGQEDPRDRALDAVQSEQQKGNTTTGYATMPWFQTPPLSPYFSAPRPGAWRQEVDSQWSLSNSYFDKDWDLAVLDAHPAVVVLSEYDYRAPERLGKTTPLAWMARLQQDYKPAAVFGGDGRAELTAPGIPLDMMYSNPKTWVWVRK